MPEHGSRAVRLEVSVYRDRFLESLISFFFFWHGGGEPLPFYKGMMDVQSSAMLYLQRQPAEKTLQWDSGGLIGR